MIPTKNQEQKRITNQRFVFVYNSEESEKLKFDEFGKLIVPEIVIENLQK